MDEEKSTVSSLRRTKNEAVVVADERGRIVEVNAAFERLFGWLSAEIVDKPLTTIIPPDFRDAHNLGFSRFVMTGEPRVVNHPILVQAITKQGKVFEAEHMIVGSQENGSWVFAARIRPL